MLKNEQFTGRIYVLLALNLKPLTVCTLPGGFRPFLSFGDHCTPHFFEFWPGWNSTWAGIDLHAYN